MIYYLGYGGFCEIDKGNLPLLHNCRCECSNHFEKAIITPNLNFAGLNNIQIVDRVINLPVQRFICTHILLHANVIDVEGKYIALVGDSCIGKTSITIKCVTQTDGIYKFVSDDFTLINEEGIVIPCCCRPLLVRSKDGNKYIRSTDIFDEGSISHASKRLAGIVYLYAGSENRSKIELLVKSMWNVNAKNLSALMQIPFTISPMICDNLDETIYALQKNMVGLGVL